jgi:Putative glycosyl hydrolase domain
MNSLLVVALSPNALRVLEARYLRRDGARNVIETPGDRAGRVWHDREQLAWTDPFLPEVWDYNLSLAVEATRHGFDEIQFDYVRFPETPGLAYARPSTEDSRVHLIERASSPRPGDGSLRTTSSSRRTSSAASAGTRAIPASGRSSKRSWLTWTTRRRCSTRPRFSSGSRATATPSPIPQRSLR